MLSFILHHGLEKINWSQGHRYQKTINTQQLRLKKDVINLMDKGFIAKEFLLQKKLGQMIIFQFKCELQLVYNTKIIKCHKLYISS